jgi:hypothetical protein
LGLVACLVLVTAGVLISVAGAQTPGGGLPAGPVTSAAGIDQLGYPAFDPQETNIPSLAWRGEEVRLVKCSSHIPSPSSVLPNQTESGFFEGNRASIFVEDWSGTQLNSYEGPKPVSDTFLIFHQGNPEKPHFGQNCLKATFISNKPGLAIIKMSASDDSGVQWVVHSFLVGWMSVNSANITNPGSVTELPGTEPGNSANVLVKGQIPLNAEFQADWGLPATLVLPDNWALWASKMATTDQNLDISNSFNSPSQYWDIHDSSGPGGDGGNPDIHVSQTACPGSSPSSTIDQVDNCQGPGDGNDADGSDQYSRVFADLASGQGPFDASYPQTLLSDGILNSFDAQMPPLKIVFNSSGGMGGFDNSVLNDKACIYNRNSDVANGNCVTPPGNVNDAHNLYAPYYDAYIPATSRDPYGIASGTDGPAYSNGASPNDPDTGQPNNFEGYAWYGSYHYWDIAQYLVQGVSQNTKCLLTSNQEPTFRKTNGFPTSIVEFTDEHGEARAQWQPGFNNDNFGTTVGFVDDNGGCDLQGVSLGAQTISAAARYPFQTVSQDIPVAGTITKNILNRFKKTVSCVRKNNVSSAVAYLCTATAQDIAGNGDVFNGEYVCFSREPQNIFILPGGSVPQYCVQLQGGTATSPATVTLETPGTLIGSLIDVQANFAGEHLLRDACIVSGQHSSTDGPCGGGGGGTTSTTSTTGTTSTSTTGTTTPAGSNAGSQLKTIVIPPGGKLISTTLGGNSVVSVQLVLTKNGRVLMVKIHSLKKTAKIQIRLINAKGKVITVVLRTVRTNKLVQVPNLRVAKNVKTVRVHVLS